MKGIKPSREVTRDRISALESGSKMNEASQMSVQMLDDPEESVRLLVFSNQWQDAIMTSATSGRPDLIETEVKPALESTAKSVLAEIKTLDSQWTERSDRIIFLREEQKNKINLLGEYDEKVMTSFLCHFMGDKLKFRVKFVIWSQKLEASRQEHRGHLEHRNRRLKVRKIAERMNGRSFLPEKVHLMNNSVFLKKQG